MTEKKLSPLLNVLIDVGYCIAMAASLALALLFPFGFWWALLTYVIQP